VETLSDAVEGVARDSGFSGAVRVDRAGTTEVLAAYGLADRAHGIPTTVTTRFATASGTKGLTALVVMALVARGALALDTTARSLLGDDLPLVADDVTVEHLLSHRSGIGDYLDENGVDGVQDYVLSLPVHRLATTEDYLPLLDGHPTVAPAGERFAYNNGGYVLLALLAERGAGRDYHDLVRTLVCEPAGMVDTAFLRSDELPGDAALGYLRVDGLRTNVLHLPVRGTGDGGAYSTVADFSAFWTALVAGRIVPPDLVAEMVHPRSDWPEESERYGLGFHLHQTGDAVWLEGYDAGVSFLSLHQPSTAVTYTVIANWSEGAWPLMRLLGERLEA
jgi:CubicO group peptidase (beta-lactamase class C family)